MEKGKPFAKEARKSGVRGIFLDFARNDGMGGMGLFHVAYNGYVGKTPLPQRHPERSRGIFLAGGDNVVCVIAGKGNPSAKGTRKRGKGETFCEGSKKKWSARNISRLCSK